MSSPAMVGKPMASTETPAANNEFLEAMKKKDGGSEEALKKAFQVLSNGHDNARVSADVLRRAIENRGLNQTLEEVEEAIHHVTKDGGQGRQINCDKFIKIVKLLEEPTVVEQLDKARGILGRAKRKNIVLYGKSGVGKTWMARKIAGYAVRKGEFHMAIWVYLNRIYDGLSLQESIAYQLSVLAAFEQDEAKREESEKEKGKQEEFEKTKEKKKRDRIEEKIREKVKEKKLLLVLDNEGSKLQLNWSEEVGKDGKKKLRLKLDGGSDSSIDLGEMLALDELESFKVLITSKNRPTGSEDIGIMVRPLSWDESKSLVFQQMDGVVKTDEIKELVEFFIGKSERLPAEILLMARIVSFFGRKDSGMQKLREDKEILEKEEGSNVGDILIRGYEKLPKSVLIDCYSSETPERHFLHRGGMVNFNDLISYWIIEGHLGHFDRIEDAYEEGHRVLMELIDCGLLEKQEGDYVTPSGARFDFDIHDRYDFFSKIHAGLGITFDMKLGRVAWADGMIKTVSSNGEEVKKQLTFMLDGNHIGETLPAHNLFKSRRELESLADFNSSGQERKKQSTLMLDGSHTSEVNRLFESLSEIENLVIFDPTGEHFQRPVEMQKLRLLVLRRCQFLNSIEPNFEGGKKVQENSPKTLQRSQSCPPQIDTLTPNSSPRPVVSHNLEKLTVLEISGPSSLKEIPNTLFEKMPNLRTINLSYLPIKELPSLFYQLTKIEFLILRGCSNLEELRSLTKLKDLQVIDLSGSTSFQKFHDKSFFVNSKLQILNLSQTKIKTLPLINTNPLLKFISLRDCAFLQRIRKIGRLEKLQIFDISGATEVEEFCDPSLESLKSLVILDVSRTAIRRLPSNISNPRYLYVKDCSHFKRQPPIDNFTKVEVIDFSGSLYLEEIRKEFFSNTKFLRELNLSKTRVERLSFLSFLGSLRRLLLVECHYLKKLEKLSSLEELEFLDLSDCKGLTEIEDDSFDKMNHLQYLNLSGIQLSRLPSLSKLKKLEELYVTDCPNLNKLTGIGELPVLKILDHTGTILKRTPSFSDCVHPSVLGANIMDNIDDQEELLKKKLGASTAEFTPDESESPDHQNVDFTLEDLRQCKWSISNWSEQTPGSSVYGTHFLQLLKKHPSLLTKNFIQFHFLVCPTKREALLVPDKNLYRNELDLRDIYFVQVSQEKFKRVLEIREFNDAPPFLGYLLKQAQFVVLIDDPVFKSLRDLGVDSIIDMKACWIERCDQLEHVIVPEKEEYTKKPDESTKSKVDPNESAKSKGEPGKPTKSKGESGESSKSKDEPGEPAKSQGESGESSKSKDEPGEPAKSQGESGESSKSKDEPGEPGKSKDEPGEPGKSKGEPGESSKSKCEPGEPAKSKGELRELAESKGEPEESSKSKDEPGKPAKSKGEPGESSKSKGEPGEPAKSKGEPGESSKSKDEPGEPAKNKGELRESAESKCNSIKNFASILEKLEILWISDCMNLRSIFKGDISFKSIKSLYLEYCPQISIMCSSTLQLESLEILYVKYCQQLQTFFTDDSTQLKNLRELHLWGLEELKSIDCIVPSLRTLRVGECPLVEHIFNPSTQGHDHQEVEGHQNIEILHIKFCDKLKAICESSIEDSSYFLKLWELELSGLPELKKIECETPFLRCLRVGECPSLKNIFCSSNVPKGVKVVEVKYCDELKTIFGGAGIDLSEVDKMELLSLPEVENVNGGKLQPSWTEKCMIWGCPKLLDPPLEQAHMEESRIHDSSDARNP